VEPGSPLLALRLGGACYALEPGRDYLLGSAPDCDLHVGGAAARHACIHVSDGARIQDLSGGHGVLVNEERVEEAGLGPGDRVALAGELMVVVADDGSAALVPVPALRQAAQQRRIIRVRAAAAALRHHERTFEDLVAEHLRRAPWLLLSTVVHALILLLLALWLRPPPQGRAGVATIHVDVAANAELGDGPPAPPEVVVEQVDEVVEEPDPLAEAPPLPTIDGVEPPREQPLENPRIGARRPNRRSDGAGSGGERPGDVIGSGSFRKEVEELQRTGLEIVFVFDSTGSMTTTITDTKATIVQMCDVLRALVPDARFGLVTYRDNSDSEDYCVRQVPLALDYWRASNFVQFVDAGGGGDRAEDVSAGLTSAIGQRWRAGARRVIVLAGDAPTHRRDLKRLLGAVRRFSGDRRSFVHTLVTSPDRAGDDTHNQFQRIAKAGRGVCEPLQNHSLVLQRVLTLAFGSQFDRDIDAVIRDVTTRSGRVDTASLALVRQGGPQLAAELRKNPVSPPLWNALVRKPREPVAMLLIDLLLDSRTPDHTRNAAAAALQRMLKLPRPPIDPESDEPLSRRRGHQLKILARKLPD
jgi:hypothetical protein